MYAIWLISLFDHELLSLSEYITSGLRAYIDLFSVLSLLEQVLSELRSDTDGQLVTATLCLLHVSAGGLLQCELLHLLASHVTPPPLYAEKSKLMGKEEGGRLYLDSIRQCTAMFIIYQSVFISLTFR